MPVEFITCEQGSKEWHAARCGIPTASRFSDILAQGKGLTRAKYMRELVGEIITGVPAETFSNAAMERGKEMEAMARAEYEFMTDEIVEIVGFVRNGRAGASPDGLINGGIIELKTKLPHLMIECIERATLPPEHKAQSQGGLWITEREFVDFAAFWPGMPLFKVREYRDDEYIATLADEVARFNDELDNLVERVRSYRFDPAPQARQAGAGGDSSRVNQPAPVNDKPADSIELTALTAAMKFSRNIADLDNWLATHAEKITALSMDEAALLHARIEWWKANKLAQVSA